MLSKNLAALGLEVVLKKNLGVHARRIVGHRNDALS